ncbi:MAG: TetR/AcrR family transcriptional regulator [Candidatus Zixiibacteriota bacterium]|nr:MAG: TetR/AcrR family transcriptional regulator [candidate division Zixibacteria bacterium]
MIKDSKIATSARILAAAREEFATHGLAGARVDRIAARAAVNKAMLYYHFNSKEKLYDAVIDEHLSRIGEFLEAQVTADADVEMVLENFAGFINDLFTERRTLIPIFLREIASGGERIAAAFTAALTARGLTRRLRKLLEDGRKRGLLRDLDSRQAIVSFMGMNLIYHLLSPVINAVWEIKDEKKFRQRRRKEVVDLFLHGLKVR